MKGAKYVLIAGLALVAAGKIIDTVQNKQDNKRGNAIAAVSKDTTSKAIGNTKPLTGPDQPLKAVDALANQYRQDMSQILYAAEEAWESKKRINAYPEKFESKIASVSLRLKGSAPDTISIQTVGKDTATTYYVDDLEAQEYQKLKAEVWAGALKSIIGMMETQMDELKLLKGKNERLIAICTNLKTKYGNYRPDGTGLGLGGIIKFYREQAAAIDAALINTGKALEQAKQGNTNVPDWAVSFEDEIGISPQGEIGITSVRCL